MKTTRRSLLSAVFVSAALCALPLALTVGSSTPAGGARPALVFSSGPSVGFEATTLGDFTVADALITNDSVAQDVISTYVSSGADPDDFGLLPDTDCPLDANDAVVLAASASCHMIVIFNPNALGPRSATLTLTDSQMTGTSLAVTGTGAIGYYEVASNGAVAQFGDANFYGDASSISLSHPIVGMAQTGDDGGYWLVASDGGIFAYGDAGFFGSAGGIRLNKPIVGMASTADGEGYWLVATDGGIFDYGDAPFFGSTGNLQLNQPIVGMAPTPDGNGYWLVASDGGIFAYGDAQFYGSTGAIHLNKPIVGMASTPDGGGYWLVASDGGVFAYGDAQFYGSTGAIHLNKPIVAAAAMPTGHGYWFAASDGGLFNYGDAPFYGSAASQGIGTVVGMATDGEPTVDAFFGDFALRQGQPQGHADWAQLPSEPRFAGR